jgi:hypothetical protein
VCASTVTSSSNPGTCAAPSCSDNVQNGQETDIDCGGTCPQCAVGQGCQVNGDCAPPTVAAPVTATTSSGVCDASGAQSCVPAEILQVAVVGAGSVSSTATGLGTGNITNCKTASGTCVQSYDSIASVTLTATSAATSGTISWTLAGTAQTCSSCTLSATVSTCPCTITISSNIKATATTP